MEGGNVTVVLQSAEDLKTANVCSQGSPPPIPSRAKLGVSLFLFLMILTFFNRCYVIFFIQTSFFRFIFSISHVCPSILVCLPFEAVRCLRSQELTLESEIFLWQEHADEPGIRRASLAAVARRKQVASCWCLSCSTWTRLWIVELHNFFFQWVITLRFQQTQFLKCVLGQ